MGGWRDKKEGNEVAAHAGEVLDFVVHLYQFAVAFAEEVAIDLAQGLFFGKATQGELRKAEPPEAYRYKRQPRTHAFVM